MQRRPGRKLTLLLLALSLIVVVAVAATTLGISIFASMHSVDGQSLPEGNNLSLTSNTPEVSLTAGATPTRAVPATPTYTPTPVHMPTPGVTPRPTHAVTRTPTPVKSFYVPSGNGQQATISTVVTWYGYNDNSGETEDQHGSAAIAYPKSDGYPTLHNHATEETGSYNNPITFAAPNKNLKGSFPIGSVIYVPFVKKYFIMEDQCGDDDPEGCQNGTNHADLWMGPAQALDGTRLDNCEGKATPDGAVSVIINPSPSLPVDTTQMYTSGNACTIHLY
ncbi:MAG TPA: hypothetical protein VFN35_17765 [Ktedonobacteraceae bacterium]|nr:hypothetical protein [Ktedonobacteraceae bacterium]